MAGKPAAGYGWGDFAKGFGQGAQTFGASFGGGPGPQAGPASQGAQPPSVVGGDSDDPRLRAAKAHWQSTHDLSKDEYESALGLEPGTMSDDDYGRLKMVSRLSQDGPEQMGKDRRNKSWDKAYPKLFGADPETERAGGSGKPLVYGAQPDSGYDHARLTADQNAATQGLPNESGVHPGKAAPITPADKKYVSTAHAASAKPLGGKPPAPSGLGADPMGPTPPVSKFSGVSNPGNFDEAPPWDKPTEVKDPGLGLPGKAPAFSTAPGASPDFGKRSKHTKVTDPGFGPQAAPKGSPKPAPKPMVPKGPSPKIANDPIADANAAKALKSGAYEDFGGEAGGAAASSTQQYLHAVKARNAGFGPPPGYASWDQYLASIPQG
jgi:hypothetical protein